MATAARISKPTTGKRLAKRKAWSALKVHYRKIGERHLRDLFEDDPERAEKFTVEAVGINFDYSKNRITEKTLRLLLELAEESGLRERIDDGLVSRPLYRDSEWKRQPSPNLSQSERTRSTKKSPGRLNA